MFVKQIRVESLGNSSYLVGSQETKVCAVVDPLRDVDMYIHEADVLGVRITHALETHVHNDFISGSRELVARTGATVCASAAGGLLFDHQPLRAGDSIALGEARLDIIATPGHTPEHISFLASDTSKPDAATSLFSGGALLVGGVARTDMMGKQLAPFLGRWFHRTIRHELQGLDDRVAVYPTHGGGSFCMAASSGSSETTSTIGQERMANPFFQAETEADFLELASGNMPSYPAYYKRMANINRRGPRILGSVPTLYPLAPNEAWVRVQGDCVAIDARSADAYSNAHIPDAYIIPLGNSFGTWVGWLVESGKPLVFVSDDPTALEEAARQLVRIGYDSLEGYLEGSMAAWEASRLPVARMHTMTPGQLFLALEDTTGPLPLDVRFDHEWHMGRGPSTWSWVTCPST